MNTYNKLKLLQQRIEKMFASGQPVWKMDMTIAETVLLWKVNKSQVFALKKTK